MSELMLVGLHEDGEHVVLQGPDGQRFRLPIDEALRAAVRRDRAKLEQVRAELTGALPPREIQGRIRAGATPEEVAEASGMPVELIRRYEGPVLAEREHVAAQAQGTRIGRDAGAPVLGDLVTDRLATRGVEGSDLRWDAYRSATGPWTVEVSFVVGGSERSARWTYEAATRSVRAVDDEARWLSETELADEPIPRRHLASVRSEVFDVEVDAALRPVLASVDVPNQAPEASEAPPPQPDPHEATEALLDDLSGRRGVRQAVDVPDEAAQLDGEGADDADTQSFEGFGPQHVFDFENPDATAPVPAAHPPASRPDQATDARVLSMPASAHEQSRDGRDAGDGAAGNGGARSEGSHQDHPGDEPADGRGTGEEAPAGGSRRPLGRGRARKGRASVPSWDEIVFGAKPE